MRPKSFFEIAVKPALFEFRGFNLFKIFYKSYLDRVSDEAVPWKKTEPYKKNRLLALFRSCFLLLWLGPVCRLHGKTIFYGVSDRYSIINGVRYDLYNAKVIEQGGRGKFVILEDSDGADPKTYDPDLVLGDFLWFFERLFAVLLSMIFRKRIREYGERITKSYNGLGFTADEVYGMTLGFYARYFVFRFLLLWLGSRKALVICHYGREPFLAACKRTGVKSVELMHGLINTHPFYEYPENYSAVFDRALFADELAVYGPYWKKLAIRGNMYPSRPDAIIVAGYYLKIPENNKGREKRKTIVVNTQPTVQKELLAYIAFLAKNLDREGWRVLINVHPAESTTPYESLVQPGFVMVSERNRTYELLASADIHISVYSTVLYEAVMYGAANYTLRVDRFAHRTKELIELGLAFDLRPDELPVVRASKRAGARDFFADYRPAILFE